MYKSESVLEKETYEFSETEIQTDTPIPTRRPDLIVTRRKKKSVDSTISVDHRVKTKESI